MVGTGRDGENDGRQCGVRDADASRAPGTFFFSFSLLLKITYTQSTRMTTATTLGMCFFIISFYILLTTFLGAILMMTGQQNDSRYGNYGTAGTEKGEGRDDDEPQFFFPSLFHGLTIIYNRLRIWNRNGNYESTTTPGGRNVQRRREWLSPPTEVAGMTRMSGAGEMAMKDIFFGLIFLYVHNSVVYRSTSISKLSTF